MKKDNKDYSLAFLVGLLFGYITGILTVLK